MGGAKVIVLDTHVWIWWVSNPENLSDAAMIRIEQAVSDKAVYVSSISTWEVAMLVAKKRLKLTMDVNDWIAKSETFPFLHFIPVTNSIAVRSVNLPGRFHSDPADRIIIATAMMQGGTLVSKDAKMLNYTHIETLW